jgi:hypothetical protein
VPRSLEFPGFSGHAVDDRKHWSRAPDSTVSLTVFGEAFNGRSFKGPDLQCLSLILALILANPAAGDDGADEASALFSDGDGGAR